MSDFINKSIALSVNTSKIGVRRKVDSRKMQLKDGNGNQPDERSIAVNKELISCESFDAIGKLDGEFRNNLYKLALPNPLFKNGTYLIPLGLIEEIDTMIENYKNNRDTLVNDFIDEYDNSVENAKERLGGLFVASDYPSKEVVARSFNVSSQYIEIGIPEKLGVIAPEIFQKEKKAFQEKLTLAADEITAAMRESFQELVNHMIERLQPDEQGNTKIFRDSLVRNFREFMDTFNARNITNDEELQKLVDQARSVLNGKSASDLRNNDDVKTQVSNGMNQIKNSLTNMIMNSPRRKFKLDD